MARKNIRNFDCIREVAAHIYTYGFYTREEFIRRGIAGSPRAYDDIIRQLRDLYLFDLDREGSPLEEDGADRGRYKCYKFRRDYFSPAGDQLSAAFGLFSARDGALEDTIRCLSAAASPEGAVAPRVALSYSDEAGRDHEPTIRRRLSSLRESGYTRREGRADQLSTPFRDLSDRDLVGLYYLAAFYAGAGYPRVAAVFLRETLRRHMALRGLRPPVEAFLFRDNACGNVFDEPVVWELLRCCRDRRAARVTLHGREQVLQPVRLKIDTRLGRWYLQAVREGKAVMARVSHIKNVTPLAETFDMEEAQALTGRAFGLNYVSGSTVHAGSPVHVEAKLSFDLPAMRQQFQREMVAGTIEQRPDGEYFCADVGDPQELKPFLRSYGPWVQVLPGPGHTLAEDLRGEYERMLAAYGPV